MKSITLTSEQLNAKNGILEALNDPYCREMSLTGWAGCGKTSVLSHIIQSDQVRRLRSRVMAPTGKAASVLGRKLKGTEVKTVHSTIYSPFEGEDGGVRFSFQGIDPTVRLLICDEASMVTPRIQEDLLDSRAKILWVGDPGQLPPVGAKSGYSALDQDHNFHLNKIHRQAKDNPIISLSSSIRKGGTMKLCSGDKLNVVSKIRSKKRLDNIIEDHDILLCGYNKTRKMLNERARRLFSRSGEVVAEDDWMCVLKNHKFAGVMNGERFRVDRVIEELGHRLYKICVVMEGGEDRVLDIYLITGDPEIDNQYTKSKVKLDSPVVVDYGYAMTVHKSQGSEWESVFVFDEPIRGAATPSRYTAITRASDRLTYAK